MLRHGADGFISPLKEGMLRIFIAHNNPPPSAGFEPANIGSNGKHAKHYITEATLTFLVKDKSKVSYTYNYCQILTTFTKIVF
jgi:hypothetical protein